MNQVKNQLFNVAVAAVFLMLGVITVSYQALGSEEFELDAQETVIENPCADFEHKNFVGCRRSAGECNNSQGTRGSFSWMPDESETICSWEAHPFSRFYGNLCCVP